MLRHCSLIKGRNVPVSQYFEILDRLVGREGGLAVARCIELVGDGRLTRHRFNTLLWDTSDNITMDVRLGEDLSKVTYTNPKLAKMIDTILVLLASVGAFCYAQVYPKCSRIPDMGRIFDVGISDDAEFHCKTSGKNGAGWGTRTPGHLITNQVLYQLS